MKNSKNKMENQVIEVLSKEHGKKVIEYWKSRGVDTKNYTGCSGFYYGVVDGEFDCWISLPPNTELITLPENKYPKVMLVSKNKTNWIKRVVFMEKNGKYLAWDSAETFEAAESSYHSVPWEYAKDIKEPQIVELTITDISEGKGVGVPPHLIRIKK